MPNLKACQSFSRRLIKFWKKVHTDEKAKGEINMKALKIYRICLVVLLLLAIGGGLWYCYESMEAKNVPEDGTLVQETNWRA